MNRIGGTRVWLVLGIASALVAGLVAAGEAAGGATSSGEVALGPVSIGDGQRAIVSVANTTKQPMKITISAYDAHGTRAPLVRDTVPSGGSRSESMSDIFGTGVEWFRVAFQGGCGSSGDCPSDVQIVDTESGRTSALLSGWYVPDMASDTSAMVMHVGSGKGLRINVTNLGSTATSFKARVLNSAGGTVATMTLPGVPPRGIGSKTWPASSASDLRVIVMTASTSRYVPSVELFDVDTGATEGTALYTANIGGGLLG